MTDPVSLAKTIESALKIANTPLFTTIIDKVTGFRLSKWTAEGEVRKKLIHDEYEKAKEGGGIMGMQYIECMRNTENLIDTAVKSSKYINPNKPNDIKMDNDFFWNTIEHAKTVSSDEMQELVAKIIAGEYNEPGNYSMSTLQTLKMLGKNELKLFEKICSLCFDGKYILESFFSSSNISNPILNDLGIDFISVQSLQALGLFLPNSVRFSQTNSNEIITINYFDEILRFKTIHMPNLTYNLPACYCLSESGVQIVKHLITKPVNGYFDWLKKNYKIKN